MVCCKTADYLQSTISTPEWFYALRKTILTTRPGAYSDGKTNIPKEKEWVGWVNDTGSLKFKVFPMIPKLMLCWGIAYQKTTAMSNLEVKWQPAVNTTRAVDFLRSTWCRPVVLEVTSLKFDSCWQCVASWQMHKARFGSRSFVPHPSATRCCITVSFIVRSANRCNWAAKSYQLSDSTGFMGLNCWNRTGSSKRVTSYNILGMARCPVPCSSSKKHLQFRLNRLNSLTFQAPQALLVLPANSTGSFVKVAVWTLRNIIEDASEVGSSSTCSLNFPNVGKAMS